MPQARTGILSPVRSQGVIRSSREASKALASPASVFIPLPDSVLDSTSFFAESAQQRSRVVPQSAAIQATGSGFIGRQRNGSGLQFSNDQENDDSQEDENSAEKKEHHASLLFPSPEEEDPGTDHEQTVLHHAGRKGIELRGSFRQRDEGIALCPVFFDPGETDIGRVMFSFEEKEQNHRQDDSDKHLEIPGVRAEID